MTDTAPKSPKEPRPSPINGPAFLVFGIIFMVLGLGTDITALVWPAVAFLLIAALGYSLQRRYEKATGYVETLPGGRPDSMPKQIGDADLPDSSQPGDAESKEVEK